MSLEQYRITFIAHSNGRRNYVTSCDNVAAVDLDYQLAVMDHAISGVVNVFMRVKYGFTPAI